jgi:hypothetical protein
LLLRGHHAGIQPPRFNVNQCVLELLHRVRLFRGGVFVRISQLELVLSLKVTWLFLNIGASCICRFFFNDNNFLLFDRPSFYGFFRTFVLHLRLCRVNDLDILVGPSRNRKLFAHWRMSWTLPWPM